MENYYDDPQAFINSVDFDVNEYYFPFWIISALRMVITSATMYTFSYMSGNPILFAMQEGEGPYYRIEDLEEAVANELGKRTQSVGSL